jgi:hypothetical protein
MKRLLALALSLVLLAGCGAVTEAPEAPTTEGTTAAATTTEAPTTEPVKTDAKPFTQDDISAIEEPFKTVGDYVRAVPAAWYRVDHWDAYGCEIIIEFHDEEPNADSDYILRLKSFDESLCDIVTAEINGTEQKQELPKVLLDAKKVKLEGIDFAKTGTAITPPRGIKVGDLAQKIFDTYPDYRTEDGDVLYDITTLYPWAKPEWGNTEEEPPEGIVGWEREPEYGFLGGRIWPKDQYYVARFIFMEKPSWWDERSMDQPWTSDIYSYYWRLDYIVEENIIQDIEFVLLCHPG